MTETRSCSNDGYRAVPRQSKNTEPATVQDAATILHRIRVQKGHIEERFRQALGGLPDEYRDRTLDVYREKRELEAAFTKSISQQLYSSKYRFLYELVQNADDSLYDEARRASKLPFLRFIITPSIFIVETNEDGFKRSNIEAVCATGKSSKKASAVDDHIGEKGFGFKSVFSVAEEVQIQSGIWSFRFEHRRGDDGLGMVTPLDAEPALLPEDVTTRITLRLSKDTTAKYQSLLNAVASMPDTTLFFLQRLRRFHIHITDLDAKEVTTTLERIALESPPDRVLIRRQEESNDETTVDESLYRCFTHVVENMPAHEYREGRRSARVELAFPVDSTSQQPKLSESGHHVFAFLPLQRLQQVQFLIQSDFVTSASRESVVDCTWNDFIVDGVAKVFATAVEDFTKDGDPLQYSWLDYLPTGSSEDRWKPMCRLITKELAEKPILQSWRQRRLRRPGELRLLYDDMLYDGKPILEDLLDDVDLAPDYIPDYVSKVVSLGARWATLQRMVQRLEAALKTSNSKLRTTEPHDAWHVAFAFLFLQAWSTTTPDVVAQKKLRTLAIIPLQNRDQWTSAPGQSRGGSLDHIYFSDVDGIRIPSSIGLNILDEHASSNPTRKAFYTALGVEVCPHNLVLERIKQAHGSTDQAPTDIPSHLWYLFCAKEEPSSLKEWIWVPTPQGYVKNSTRLYFPSEEAHHLHHALTGVDPSRYRGILEFVDKTLVELEQSQGNEWKKWLEQATGAKYNPPLVHDNAETSLAELSPALRVVYECKPAAFLNMLRTHWLVYQEDAPRIEADLRAIQVRCVSMIGEPRRYEALQNTYLPSADIVDEVQKLGLSLGKFLVLAIPDFRQMADKLDKAGLGSWRFLEEFGVRSEKDLGFYKLALQAMKTKTKEPDFGVLQKIYAGLAKFTTADDHDDLCDFFSQELLWIPSSRSWVGRARCNWEGPTFMRHKSLLHPPYKHDPALSRFFQKTLDVPDTIYNDVIRELITRRKSSEFTTSLSVAGEIYSYICDNTVRDEDWQTLRMWFEKNDLILGTHDVWHTLETCVWHSRFLLSGYEDLSSIYPQLESFFVKHLKVKKVTPNMLIKEISKMVAKKSPDYGDVRKRLIDVGRMLTTTKMNKATKDSLADLGASKFLPKRLVGGGTALLSRHDAYAIRDHARYGSAFEEHGILLDFSVEEAQVMDVMFTHIGVKRHYLSSLVVEKSTVEEGSEEDDGFTQQLRVKAYALYCCAAKHKSVKALSGDHSLFEMLSAIQIFRGDLATHLVIDSKDPDLHLSVRSERSYIHHELAEDGLRICVPRGPKQRQTCYRSQLPKLLADIMHIGPSACHDISVIIGCDLRTLDDVLGEQDIPSVSWLEKPVNDISDDDGEENEDEDEEHAAMSSVSGRNQHVATAFMRRHASLDQEMPRLHDNRSSERKNIDLQHGAQGERYVYDVLSTLEASGFNLDNWQSNIRGTASKDGITDWQGMETADIVHTDRDGILTQWLKTSCTGGFPEGTDNRNFAERPIEYYLEVKTTTGPCENKFYLSTAQYRLMHSMTVQRGQEPTKIYVIMRVFNLLSSNKGLEVFVDPLRLQGQYIEFEAEGWTGKKL